MAPRPRKVPITSGFSVSAADMAFDWPRIEKKYGFCVAPDLRQKIESDTLEYMAGVWFEETAGPVASAEVVVAKVRSAALKLKQALPALNLATDESIYARNLLFNELWNGPAQAAADPIAALQETIDKFIDATENAIKSFKDPNQSVAGGDAWELWVVRVTTLLKTRGLPTGARHETDEAPFVILIDEMQKSLLPMFRRHGGTLEALARAITRARQPTQG
jgi:hypothetical protein